MSKKERERKAILDAVKQGYLTLQAASVRLGISYRQTKRLWKAYGSQGDRGLIHGNRGKVSNRARTTAFRDSVLAYYREKLMDFTPTFASEKLRDVGLGVDHETLRRWLVADGLWLLKKRRSPYRRRRERRECFGELVQVDGSFHDWCSDNTTHCLMNMIDDATGITLARLFEQETTEAAMRMLWLWIERYGVPLALYTDKRSVYVTGREPTLEEQLAGVGPLTAFGLACYKLGIEVIIAHSPQAKGRVERSNGTYQNRLVQELKFRDIHSRDHANLLLEQTFCDDLNQRFARSPQPATNAHRQLTARHNLYDIFCWEETRRLQNDWTIRYDNAFYQLAKTHHTTLKPKVSITVRRHLDGNLTLVHNQRVLIWQRLDDKPGQSQPAPRRSPHSHNATARNSSQHSPWRQFNPAWLKPEGMNTAAKVTK